MSACAACHRAIHEAARLCPYCGANPLTGEKHDPLAGPRISSSAASEAGGAAQPRGVMELARRRQGIGVTFSAIVALLALAGLHWFVATRNATQATDSPAVPLTEVADIPSQVPPAPPPMPPLGFRHEGNAKRLETAVVEAGAIPPSSRPAAAVAKPTARTKAPGSR